MAFYYDYKYPFSNGKYVAEYIEKNFDKDEIVIIGYTDYAAETITAYLDKDIYSPQSKSFQRLVRWPERIREMQIQEVFNEAAKFTRNNDTVLVIISNKPVDNPEIYEKHHFKKMDMEFDDTIISLENSYLYLFDKKAVMDNLEFLFKIDYSNFSDYSSKYYWSVNLTDGTFWTNETFSFTTGLEPGAWWNHGWLYRKEIVIDYIMVDDGLANFPVLINITDSDLQSKAQTTGNDVTFTDYYGNQLNHEIELYNATSGHLVAWVNVTSLSSTVDTILYLYYGNPTRGSEENIEGTWNSNYLMVHHLNETSGSHYDSTSNNNDATAQNGINQDATGKIDGADSYDDTDDFLLVSGGTANLLDNSGSWTYEAWIYPTKETCNIIAGSFINKLATVLDVNPILSVPSLVFATPKSITSLILTGVDKENQKAVLLKMNFRVELTPIECDIILLLDQEPLNALVNIT